MPDKSPKRTGNVVSAEARKSRSALMSRIRSKDTGPEVTVRKALHAQGLRFRLHRKELPGKPDIVLSRHRIAIFVNGCFWHQHEGCRLASKPKSRQEYWQPKFARNVERDRLALAGLAELGWTAFVIWECQVRDKDQLEERIVEIMAKSRES